MPIHNLGYREWNGTRESGSSRWTVVAGIGIKRAWSSTWLKRMLVLAWVAPLVSGVLIFIYEQAVAGDMRMVPPAAMVEMLREVFDVPVPPNLPRGRNLPPTIAREVLEQFRTLFWSSLMYRLLLSQCVPIVIVIGLIAPPLISQDVRSRAFLLYFSRPLSRVQYLLGKSAGVLLFVMMISTVPIVLLYLTGVLLSPDISIIMETWDIPLRGIAASLTICIPSVLVALMLSSLTVESRIATLAWFAIWIFGFAAFIVMEGGGISDNLILRLGYLYLLFSDLSAWILNVPFGADRIFPSLVWLIALCSVTTAVFFRRISAPMRV